MLESSQSEKWVLVTGCSSGIGFASLNYLKDRGYHVIASARQKSQVASLQQAGFPAVTIDLNDENSISTGVTQTMEICEGKLYALFNNAGFGQPGAIEDISRNAIRLQFETNVFGTIELTNAIIPYMRKQGFGRIIFNSSVLGLVALPYRGAYNASKFALEALADTLRLELEGTPIFVSLIEPGPIISRFRQNSLKAFKINVNAADSPHKNIYEKMENRLIKEKKSAPFTLEAEAVCKKVYLALNKNRPKHRYYVTQATYLLAACRWLLPSQLMDKLLIRLSNNENR